LNFCETDQNENCISINSSTSQNNNSLQEMLEYINQFSYTTIAEIIICDIVDEILQIKLNNRYYIIMPKSTLYLLQSDSVVKDCIASIQITEDCSRATFILSKLSTEIDNEQSEEIYIDDKWDDDGNPIDGYWH